MPPDGATNFFSMPDCPSPDDDTTTTFSVPDSPSPDDETTTPSVPDSPSPDDGTTSSSYSVPDSPSPPTSPDDATSIPTCPFHSVADPFPFSAALFKINWPLTANTPQQPPLSTDLSSLDTNPNSLSPSTTLNPNPNQATTSFAVPDSLSPDDETTSAFSVPDSPSPPSSPDHANSIPTPPFLSAVDSFPLSALHFKSKSPLTANTPQQPQQPPLSTDLSSLDTNPNSPSPSPNQAQTLTRHQLQHPSTSQPVLALPEITTNRPPGGFPDTI
ncbi:uncharacterized protein LOC144549052 [Carex rostrata]